MIIVKCDQFKYIFWQLRNEHPQLIQFCSIYDDSPGDGIGTGISLIINTVCNIQLIMHP